MGCYYVIIGFSDYSHLYNKGQQIILYNNVLTYRFTVVSAFGYLSGKEGIDERRTALEFSPCRRKL